jgi:hypothetical protein
MEMLLVTVAALVMGGVTLWVISLLARASTKQKQISGVVIDPTIAVFFGGWIIEQVSIGQAARIQSVTKTELEKVFGRPVVVQIIESPINVQVNGDLNPHAASVAIDIATKVAMSVK